jgi:ribosomal protein L12E/L44/L45/RPP1/RPP2
MAEDIRPSQPISPSLPVNPPPEDKRRQHEQKKKQTENEEQNTEDDKPERPHQGLFDEYV